MGSDHMIWREQCDAARGIREQFGSEKAMGYLLGEKLLDYMRAASKRPDFVASLPAFAAEITSIFEPWEISGYLSKVRRLGALGHVATDEQHEILRSHDAVDEDIVTAAEDVLLIERMKVLLLGSR